MNEASSLAKKTTAEATSSGLPNLGHGVRAVLYEIASGAMAAPVLPVIILPGATALQTMPSLA